MGDRAVEALRAVEFLELMVRAREGDRREGLLLRQNRGWFHVAATGHEALGALAYHLRPDDYLYLYYRDRGIALARGLTNYELALAYFAKAESSSAGRMMPAPLQFAAAQRVFRGHAHGVAVFAGLGGRRGRSRWKARGGSR